MSERTTKRAAAAVGSFAAALTAANIVLLVLGRDVLNDSEGDLFFGIVVVIASILYVGIGLLIAVRAGSAIGWFLAGIGLSYALLTFGNGYAAVALVTFPGSLPAAEEIATLLSQYWIFGLVALCLLLLFPDGRPLSPRWRLVMWTTVAASVATYLLFLLKPFTVQPVTRIGFPNPFAVPNADGFVGPALVVTAWATVLGVVGCFAGLIVRYRRGDIELQGMKDRVEVPGGTLVVESSPRGGTTLMGSIPTVVLTSS